MSTYFGEPEIASERVSAIADPIWIEATALAEDDWFLFLAQYDATTADVEEGVIDRLEVGYAVLSPIPYRIEKIADDNYQASFDEGNIAIGGRDPQDAYQSLVAEILDTFDVLEAEPTLSQDAEAQFRLLRTYIAKT